MTEAELYARADHVLGSHLLTKGFRRKQPAEYLRASDRGAEDRMLVSKGPPSRAGRDFAVFLSHYPSYLEPLREIYGSNGEDRGFLCGPYLNPVGVRRKPKYWSYKDADKLAKSLDHVLHCLENAGLPWLESLRDPKVFAANVDPMATLSAAIAHEAAGNPANACKFYLEDMRRFIILIKDFGEDVVLQKDGRAFIFVARKLNAERALCDQFERRLNYHPSVQSLRCDGGILRPAAIHPASAPDQ